jgi:MoaA/NifB/PqqE/SkfB family radical SAM enzyme
MKIYNILINVTERCHVGCRHCGYIGSRRDREMTVDEMADWVGQLCIYAIPKIIFTGGEAFERFDLLGRGVRRAHESGVPTAVFTSAFWAKTPESARETLREISTLRQLYISTDKYHQERVPLTHVYNAIDAALEIGIPRITMTITYANQRDLAEVSSWYSCYGGRVEITSQLLIPNKGMRRDETQYIPQFDLSPKNYESSCFMGTPLINPNGDVFACHIGKVSSHRSIKSSPYALGNLRESSFVEIMGAARKRSDYQYLVAHGPRGVAESMRAQPEAAKGLPRNCFTSGCDMCMSVMLAPSAAEAFRRHAEASTESTEIKLALLAMREPSCETLDAQVAGAK